MFSEDEETSSASGHFLAQNLKVVQMRMKTEAKSKLSLDNIEGSSHKIPLTKKVLFIYENSLN